MQVFIFFHQNTRFVRAWIIVHIIFCFTSDAYKSGTELEFREYLLIDLSMEYGGIPLSLYHTHTQTHTVKSSCL